MFTRMKQYNKLHHIEYYHWQEMHLVEQIAPIWQWSTYAERLKVKIEPAVFGKIEYYPGTPVANLDKKPARGYDELICEGNGVTVFMTLWFTEQGYHAIIWDNMDKQQQRDLFQQYLQRMGYQIEQSSPVFEELLQLYLSGEWGEMVETDFRPTWIWRSRVAEKLLEPYKQWGGF